MVHTGIDIIRQKIPKYLKGKRIGIICHAASVAKDYAHIVDILAMSKECTLDAIFGPQHGLYGQTQDNMIEWSGYRHPRYKVPVYSLYGETRKPTAEMLKGLDTLVFDLQDVGARPYTYLWTLKLCMEACVEHGLGLVVLDRPNPIGAVGFDGPMIDPAFFSFVGGAKIPLCHRMTIGEVAQLIKMAFFPKADLHVVWMRGWWRSSLWSQTGLPWIMPSPNMPTIDSAIVYPGMVLLEATNISEGRGTTHPFELFGAPFIVADTLIRKLERLKLLGVIFREHNFIPSFQKWGGTYCGGVHLHVTDYQRFEPVLTTAAILAQIRLLWPKDFCFKEPPYEYEQVLKPFDILSGSTSLRESIDSGIIVDRLRNKWNAERKPFEKEFLKMAHYQEKRK